MTECNRLPVVFSSLHRKKLAADFQGGDLTSDGRRGDCCGKWTSGSG
jgi:hypothetical protein